MACVKHNLAMVRLVLRGRVQTPVHAELLADVRRCRRCGDPTPVGRHADRRQHAEPPRVPQVRVEQSIRQLEDSRR